MNQRRYSRGDRARHQHISEAFSESCFFFHCLFVPLLLNSTQKYQCIMHQTCNTHDWVCWAVSTFAMKLESSVMTELCQNVISHRIECWDWAADRGSGRIIKKGKKAGGDIEGGNDSDGNKLHKKCVGTVNKLIKLIGLANRINLWVLLMAFPVYYCHL